VTIKVGIDYDEPIFPWYDYAHDASVAAGLTTMEQDPPTQWDPTTVYGCPPDDWYEVINAEVRKGPAGMYGRPIKPGVAADLWRLHNRGVEIHIVTARGQFGAEGKMIQDLTRQQVVKEIGLPKVRLHFTKDKFGVIKKHGIQYFLDDRYPYFQEAIQAGAKSYLLDERWNQQERVLRGHRLYTTRQYVDKICRAIDQPTGSEIFGGRDAVRV
jgi:hypothetical protein